LNIFKNRTDPKHLNSCVSAKASLSLTKWQTRLLEKSQVWLTNSTFLACHMHKTWQNYTNSSTAHHTHLITCVRC